MCVFLFSVADKVFSNQHREFECLQGPSFLSACVVRRGCQEEEDGAKKTLFVWVNPPRPFPFAIGRKSSQWVGGEVDFLWANYTGPTCKIFLTSPMVFILKRKKEKRSPSLRKTLSLCMWYLDACLVFVLLCRDWWRKFRFFSLQNKLFICHMYEACMFVLM